MKYSGTIQLVIFLLSLSTFHTVSSYLCSENLTKTEVPVENSAEEDDYPFYYIQRTEWVTDSAMITCFNITNISSMPLQEFKERNYSQYLTVTNSNISTILPFAFVRFHAITRLYLSQLNIKVIYPDAFKNLSRLQQLHLDHNDLTQLSNGVFNSLGQLEVLNLGNNRIQEIDKDVLLGIGKLLELYLNDNSITVLKDDMFEEQPYLKTLDLSGNPLKQIENWNISNLQQYSLSRLSLDQFNINLSNSTVVFLNLSTNQLSTIDFSRLSVIQQLDLSRNRIDSLVNFTQFSGYYLNFDNNRIMTVSGPFWKVSELYFSHNLIRELQGSAFNQSENMKILDLSFNSISKIDVNAFRALKYLQKLYLHHNRLSRIEPGTFRNLTELTVLDLSHNTLTELQFGTFDSLVNLVYLEISHNKLIDLHQYTFNSLRSLNHLYFDNNNISSFDVVYLSKHLHLTAISLDNNPWNCQDLVKMEHILRSHGTTLVDGESYDVENVHGIACINQKEFEDHHNTSGHFHKALTKGVENFLNQEFKSSKLFRFFSENHSDTNFSAFLAAEKHQLEGINNNKGLVAVSVVQVVVSCLMLVLIAFIFIYLRKLKLSYHRSELSSQMELI